MDIERLMDMASEPHQSNIYMSNNFSELTDIIANRLSDIFCNSKHLSCYTVVMIL